LPPTSTPTPAAELFLDKNHFNPAREQLHIKLGVVETGDFKLGIYSLTGRRVWSQSRTLPPGYLTLDWDGRNDAGEVVGSGVYFVVLQSNGQKRFVRKVLVIK
jgi:flagellar hook assembly protein FlgD